MRLLLNLGENNSRWTTAQDDRLTFIVQTELGHNLHGLDDKALEGVLDEIGQRYTVGRGHERNRNGLRLRLKKLRDGIYIHSFFEYERIRRDGRKYLWKSVNYTSHDTYQPAEIIVIDERREEKNPSLKLFIRHDVDKKKGTEDLVSAAHIGLDWIIEGKTAYYVRPKIEGTDYAQMFVDVFSLSRDDSFDEYRILVNERSRMYQIDHSRQPIPLSKKKDNLSIQILTDLLLVHLIDMTWIMVLASRFITTANPWDPVRGLIRRARKSSLITKEAEQIISIFLEKKEKDSSREAPLKNHTRIANVDDIYGGSQIESYDSLVNIMESILSSAEDSNSHYLIIPPFRIDMPKLFELYIYWLISKMNNGSIKHLIRYQTTCKLAAFDDLSGSGAPQPDFLIEGKGVLIDAKYKVDYNAESYYSADDIRQLISYTQLCKVACICNAKKHIKTLIAFPSSEKIASTRRLKDMYDTARLEVKKNPDVIELYKCAFPLPKIV